MTRLGSARRARGGAAGALVVLVAASGLGPGCQTRVPALGTTADPGAATGGTSAADPSSAGTAVAVAPAGSAGPAAPPLPPDVWSLPLGEPTELLARVAALDLDGDGRDEVAIASAAGVRVLRAPTATAPATVLWSAPARGGANGVVTGDLDGDGRKDLVVGWGVHRDHKAAPTTLSAYLTSGAAPGTLREEVAAHPDSVRAQISSVEVTRLKAGGPAGILWSHFISKYEVRAVFSARDAGGEWNETVLDVVRMAQVWTAGVVGDRGDAPEVFVGRPYGDAEKSDGDVFGWGPGGTRDLVPTRRGVRAVALLDLGLAARRLCFGDGWHWEYGTKAEGLLTCATRGPDGVWKSALVADTDGFEVGVLAAGDVDGDGRAEIVSLGNKDLLIHDPDATAAKFTSRPFGPGGYHFTLCDTNGDGVKEAAMAGERPVLLGLRVPSGREAAR